MPGMSALEAAPLVSVVTPCLNSGKFLAATIDSIQQQDYPRVEHIVVDGGSTDGSLEILRRYPHVKVITGRDRGAADAINRGFAQASGEYFAYLNADDVYLPGALSAAVAALQDAPEAGGVYGDAWWIDEEGVRLAPYPVCDFDPRLLEQECFLCQPATLLRASVFENLGRLDADCDLTFDYEFWMRLARTYTLRRIPFVMAESRMHRANKSLGRRVEVFRETFTILRRHYGYVPFRWIYSYACWRNDGRDQFFQPLEPSLGSYAASLPLGLRQNPAAMGRYLAEWMRVMSWQGFRRRLLKL